MLKSSLPILATAFLIGCDGSTTAASIELGVNLGVDRTVASASTITLSADISNSLGDVSYTWSQSSGTEVTLSDTNAAQPTFTAPTVSRGADAPLVFSLLARDETGREGADTVTLTVSVPHRAVFFSQPNNVGVTELLVFDALNETTTVINGPMSPNGDVTSWYWRPDESTLAFRTRDGATQNLFVVRPDGTSLTEVAESSNLSVKWVPDGSRLIFSADAETSGVQELFSCLPDGTGLLKISGTVALDGDVIDFDVTPDSQRIVFRGDIDTDTVQELYSVSADGTNFQKLSQAGLAGDVSSFTLAPSGSSLVFLADVATIDEAQLFQIDATGGTPVDLSGTLVTGGSIQSFEWSPTGTRIAYRGDPETDGLFELFAVDPDGMNRIKLNGALATGRQVRTAFEWAPDGSRISFQADPDVASVFELFTVLADGTVRIKMHPDLVSGRAISDIQWSPDSTFLAYLADQETNDVLEVFVVNADGSNNTKVSGTMVSGGDATTSIQWAPDSSRLLYRADQEINGRTGVFTSTPTGSNVSLTSVINGSITTAEWAPDSSGIVYLGRQRGTQQELFYVLPDGTGRQLLTPTRGTVIAETFEFRWRPDSESIALIGNYQTYFARDMFTVSTDGQNLKAHTEVPYTAAAQSIRWAPEDL